MDQGSARYLHGTAPEEQRRLSLLNDIINDASLRELHLEMGARVVDMGCGLAQLTRAMARAVGPKGYVLGIERSPEQLAEAEQQARDDGSAGLVELRRGDVFDPPLTADEWGSFDLAHARFLLEHVTDPLAAVRAMVRSVRRGGRIVLEDDDHDLLRLWPESPGFAPLWQAYIRTFDRNGNDPFVGRKLVALLYEAGATPVRTTSLFFGGCAGTQTLFDLVDNLIGLLEGMSEPIIDAGLFDRSDFALTIASLRTWSRRPDAAFWYGVSWAEGVRAEVGPIV